MWVNQKVGMETNLENGVIEQKNIEDDKKEEIGNKI